jgi:hypothetical protein
MIIISYASLDLRDSYVTSRLMNMRELSTKEIINGKRHILYRYRFGESSLL